LVPLHYPTFTALGMKTYTQLSTSCVYMVFNCYKVVKKKWYQRGFFKIIVVIAVIVISVVLFAPSGGTSSFLGAGLLGSSAAVGAALGFSGLAAAIVGAVANAIAAALLLKIVQAASIAIFGDKLGLIIGTIAGIVALNVGTNFMNTGSLSMNWGALTKADSLLRLTSAVGNDFAQIEMQKVQGYAEKSEAAEKDYEQQSQQISDLYAQNIGSDRGIFDPMSLTSIGSLLIESPDAFLNRTLMTGSDIAQLTQDLLSNFTELTLEPRLPL
jgi:hypothetical protein